MNIPDFVSFGGWRVPARPTRHPRPHGSALNPGKLVVKGWRMTRCGGTNPGQEKHQEFAGEWRCDFPPNISKYGDNIPIGSMYGIYANIGGILMVNVIIYSIHGSYGICNFIGFDPSPFSKVCKLTAGDKKAINAHRCPMFPKVWRRLGFFWHTKLCWRNENLMNKKRNYLYHVEEIHRRTIMICITSITNTQYIEAMYLPCWKQVKQASRSRRFWTHITCIDGVS